MNFDFNEKELAFLAQMDQIVTGVAGQAGKKVGADQPRKILSQFSQTPYLKLGIEPVPDMGALVVWMAAMERFAAAYPSLFLTVEMSTRVFGRLIAARGTQAQKDKYLSPLLAGSLLGAVALSEQAMNTENDPLSTTGAPDGGGVIVNGTKNFVVNGPVANVIAVAGQMDGKTAVFLVPSGAPGLTIGEPLATLGYEGAQISTISLENCRVSMDQVLGPFDTKELLGQMKLWENQVLLGACLGGMRAAFEAAKNHAKEHKSGGRPIIAYQEVGFKLSEMLTMLQTAQLLAFRAAWTAEKEPGQAPDVTLCAKVFCAESAETVAGAALQILSGAGFVAPNVAERAFRNAKYAQIAGTSTEICRVKIGGNAIGL